MQDSGLKEKLEELHLELLNSPAADLATQEKRNALLDQIRTLLEKEDLAGEQFELMDFLNENILHFQEAHPRAAQITNQIIGLLSSIGI